MDKTLGLVGCCLLAVSVLDFLSLYSVLLSLFQQAMIHGEADPRTMAGQISQEIVLQMVSSFHYLIALILISIATFKYRLTARWFTLSLRIFGVILLLTPIANSLIGVYVLFIGWKKPITKGE
jgi:hypothetical protein